MKKLSFKNTLISCYIGYITQAIIVNFMPILFAVFQDEFGISFSQLGSLVLLNFVTQIGVDIVSARYVDRIGFRKSAIPAHIFSAVGLILLGILPSFMPAYPALMISVVIFAIGGGMIEVVVSPIVDAMPADDSSAAMSLLHSFYCWGQLAVVLLTTLMLKLFGYGIWRTLAFLWALVPIVNIINFSLVPLPPTCRGERTPVKGLLKTKKFLIALLLMTAAGASEQVMAQWVSLFAQKGLQVSKVVGDLLGPCLFALFMAIGRMWYGIKGEKTDLKKALMISGIMCVICYLGAVFLPQPILSLAACALTGFTVSLMWPGVLADTSIGFPNGGATMFGILAIFGDIGCSIGPWLTGLISDYAQQIPAVTNAALSSGLEPEQIALKTGILVGIIFPMLMISGIVALRKK